MVVQYDLTDTESLTVELLELFSNKVVISEHLTWIDMKFDDFIQDEYCHDTEEISSQFLSCYAIQGMISQCTELATLMMDTIECDTEDPLECCNSIHLLCYNDSRYFFNFVVFDSCIRAYHYAMINRKLILAVCSLKLASICMEATMSASQNGNFSANAKFIWDVNHFHCAKLDFCGTCLFCKFPIRYQQEVFAILAPEYAQDLNILVAAILKKIGLTLSNLSCVKQGWNSYVIKMSFHWKRPLI